MAKRRVSLDEEIRASAESIGAIIGTVLPAGWGFALLIFNFGEGGTMNYVSNADRADMLKAMKELIGNIEGETRG